jgi:hypothetical protein
MRDQADARPPEVLDLDDGVGEEPSEAAAAVSALQGVFGLDLDSEDEEGENEEDRLYLDNYRDQDDLCPVSLPHLPNSNTQRLMVVLLQTPSNTLRPRLPADPRRYRPENPETRQRIHRGSSTIIILRSPREGYYHHASRAEGGVS